MTVWILEQLDEVDDSPLHETSTIIGVYTDPVSAMMDADEMPGLPIGGSFDWYTWSDYGFWRTCATYGRSVCVRPFEIIFEDSPEMP